ncbi:MAG TPA: diguanylate cyclase [Acidimicrobiales bacterium]|nr:diguanylate cyclase [Acidimicrobiales bacterium]
MALEMVPFAMLIADASGRVLAVNQRWCRLSSLDEERSLGTGWLNAVIPEARLRLQADMRQVVSEGTTATSDHQLAGGARPRWSRWWLSRHASAGRSLIAIAAADVDEDYARQANLYHLATHDALTGLANRSHFMETIEQALRRNERQGRRVGVVYVDLDGFKRVNDQGGHRLGDRVLFTISGRLRHAVRAADTVARIGGDEFAVLCEGLSAVEQADIVARRIEQALAESVELDGQQWTVPASVGAAVDHGSPDTAENLVDRADRAMYTIKNSRRVPMPDTAPSGAPPSESVPAPPAATVAAPPEPRPGLDLAGLRESLDSIRSVLDRMLPGDAPPIDLRRNEPGGPAAVAG